MKSHNINTTPLPLVGVENPDPQQPGTLLLNVAKLVTKAAISSGTPYVHQPEVLDAFHQANGEELAHKANEAKREIQQTSMIAMNGIRKYRAEKIGMYKTWRGEKILHSAAVHKEAAVALTSPREQVEHPRDRVRQTGKYPADDLRPITRSQIHNALKTSRRLNKARLTHEKEERIERLYGGHLRTTDGLREDLRANRYTTSEKMARVKGMLTLRAAEKHLGPAAHHGNSNSVGQRLARDPKIVKMKTGQDMAGKLLGFRGNRHIKSAHDSQDKARALAEDIRIRSIQRQANREDSAARKAKKRRDRTN